MFTPPAHRACQTSERSGGRLRSAASFWGGVLSLVAAPSCRATADPVEAAVLLSQKGQDREAIRLLEQEIRARPEAIAERRLLVRLHAVTGDLGSAEREAEELAHRLPPSSPVPWLELGHALELSHRYDEALALYDRAGAVAPKDPAGPRTGGLRSARWGEMEWALPRLEEALRRDPRDASVWHALGLVRLRLHDLEGAHIAYESGLVADPRALENRVGLATLALVRGDPRSALAQYDRILAERPSFAEGYLGRSWALISLGRWAEARGALDEARRNGADPHAVARQARWLEGRGSAKNPAESSGNP